MKRFVEWAARITLLMSAALFVAGCSGAKKVVAHVNKDVITQEEFNARTENVTAANLAPALAPGGPRGPGKAGEYAMDSLVAEKLLLQMTAERKCVPTDAQINAYVTYAKKYQTHPEITLLPQDPNRSDADWRRDARYTVAFLNMLRQQVKLEPAEIQTAYDKFKERLRERDQYHIRIVDLTTKEKAQKALDSLKKLPFETVALTQSEDVNSGRRNGDVGFIQDTQLPPPWLAALQKLKPNEYTKQVIVSSVPTTPSAANPTGAATTHYSLLQLVEKRDGRVPTLDEVRPMVEFGLIQQKDPGGAQRLQNALREFQQKATITITLKPYDALFDKQRRAAAAAQQQAAAGTPAPVPGQ